jgi:signal transduction histidine kinase
MNGSAPAASPETGYELRRLKTDFLTSLDDEFRTPLAGILGMTDLLLETGLTDEQREYLSATRVCAEELLELLSSAVQYTALAAGAVTLEDAEFNLPETLQGAMEKELPKARANAVRLLARLEETLPTLAVGDAVRLEQVTRHLLRSAIELTPEGEAELAASAQPSAGDGFLLSVEVRDTGVLISPEQLAVIFEPFRQLEGSLAQNHRGSGLSLALAEKLVRLMRGEIAAHSEPGLGTRIRVQIPLRAAA